MTIAATSASPARRGPIAGLIGPVGPGRNRHISLMGVESTTQESPQRPPRRRPLGEVLREAPVTAGMFAICIAVFLVAQSVGDTTTNATLIQFGASGRTWVWAGEP